MSEAADWQRWMGNMDQNSEALNRSIAESLSRINRARRLRALMTLTLGLIIFLYSFLPVFLNARVEEGPIAHRPIIGALSILALGNGIIQLVMGPRARIFYEKQIRLNALRIIIFWGLLVGLLFLVDFALTALLIHLGHQFSAESR